jgi:hypothetical protein
VPDSAEFKINQKAELDKLKRESMLNTKLGAATKNWFSKALGNKITGIKE